MGDIYQKLAEMQKQVEGMRQENRVQLELIKQENSTQMELIRYEIAQLMSTIGMKILDQPIQLHLEESSSVFAECSELVENEECVNPKFQYYAYFYCRQGLFRFKIPSSRNESIKIEPVILNNPTNPLPHGMALFSHCHNHKIYMVGGQSGNGCEYSHYVYVFDPNRFHNLPIDGLTLLDKPKDFNGSFKPMMHPSLILSEDRIYLISVCNYFSKNTAPFCFQSFDLIKNHFETLTSPPYEDGQGTIMGFFHLRGFIYLFIRQVIVCEDHFAYIFNTRTSKWEKHILDRFDELEIPIPSSSIGDVGLSDKFCDNHQILVILNSEGPAAYCVQLLDDGSLQPNSYRRLDEIFIHKNYETRDDYAHLHDIGQGRFCVVYQSYRMPLLIYAFKIDFEVEHEIQMYGINKLNPSSSHLLYSKKCDDPFPLWGLQAISTLCLASATSNEGRDMAAASSVDEDVEGREKKESLLELTYQQ